jgi:hypothetical protein
MRRLAAYSQRSSIGGTTKYRRSRVPPGHRACVEASVNHAGGRQYNANVWRRRACRCREQNPIYAASGDVRSQMNLRPGRFEEQARRSIVAWQRDGACELPVG